jgi:hypothetical protein
VRKRKATYMFGRPLGKHFDMSSASNVLEAQLVC